MAASFLDLNHEFFHSPLLASSQRLCLHSPLASLAICSTTDLLYSDLKLQKTGLKDMVQPSYNS